MKGGEETIMKKWQCIVCGFIYDEEEDLTRPPEEGSWHGHLPKAVDRYIEYIPNRLVAFSAHKWHQADAVNRECYDLRSIIVFKCLSEISHFHKMCYVSAV